MNWEEAARGRDRRALGRLLTLLDDGDPLGLDALGRIGIARLPHITGVTGAAGVGKSSLLARLLVDASGDIGVPALRSDQREIVPARRSALREGVLMIDPTSPVSGGAVLGDRVRLPAMPEHIFVRSVATRGGSGGLSDKLLDMIAALAAFGCERVYVETVGTGQDETAIRQVADTVVLVDAPGLGDEIQALKASPVEVADIVVMNKSDRPGAREAAAVLEETSGKRVLLASASDGQGIGELAAALAAARDGADDARRVKQKLEWRLVSGLNQSWRGRFESSARALVSGGGDLSVVYRQLARMTSAVPDHVAVAVADIESAIRDYEKIGFLLEARETVASDEVEVAFLNVAGFHIELLRPLSSDGPVAKFIAERGGGLHHIAFEVADVDAKSRELESAGVKTLGVKPGSRGKRICFVHPKSAARTLIEFCS